MGIDILTKEAQGLSEKEIDMLVELVRQMKKIKNAEIEDEKPLRKRSELFGMCPGIVIHEGFDDIPEGFEDYV